MQEQAMKTLTSLLAPSGFLFVGPAEAFLASSSGFTSVNHPMSFGFRRTPSNGIPATNASWPGLVKPIKRHLAPPHQAPVKVVRLTVPVPPTEDVLGTVRRLANAGQLAEAVESCESYLRHQGPSVEAHYLLGLIQDALGAKQKAIENYRKTVYLAPDHTEALIHLALLIEGQGDVAGAGRLRERSRRAERNRKDSTS
jgi:chemotaxis protein methyltransferase WspC